MDAGPESLTSQPPPLGTVLGGRYTLLRFLGSGAIGAVYEAATPSDERVAVKVLLEMGMTDPGKELAKRFVREVQVASTIDSNHVMPVIDSGSDPSRGLPFLVMPLLSGFDLEQLLDQTGALHPTVAVRIAMQACRGLMAAHRNNVVHRDVKPGNLYLEHQPSGQVTVRVLDFGLAKLASADQAITATGSVIGTPHYMSPEQSTNARDVDERADVWGVGAMLYRALTGATPFEEMTRFVDLHLAINSQPVKPIQERARWIDPGLATVVHGTLLRDREARCPNMSELAAALEPFTLGSMEISTMMLEPVPAVLRRVKAPRAQIVEAWERSAPRSQMPAVSAAPVDPLLGKKVGRYTLLRRLSQGASGALYEALGPNADRFAVRVMGATDPLAGRRFVREARALERIDSPHVVRLLDAGFDEASNQPYVVMELLQGKDMQSLLDKHGAIEPQQVVPLFIQACQGLDAAHALDIVHRDIRPRNLFLEEQPDGNVVVKVTSFGSVKADASFQPSAETRAMTEASDFRSDARYMSPEQTRNPGGVGPRSDIWSMGATLFHALAGEPPWPEELQGPSLLVEIARGRPGHVQDKAPWVKRGLAEVVHRTLKRDPAERYESAAELAAALQPHAFLTRVRLRELGPVPTDLRRRIEDRAEPPAPVSGDEGSEGVEPMPIPLDRRSGPERGEPEPAAVEELKGKEREHDDGPGPLTLRRRSASRASWLLVIVVVMVAAVAAYAGYQLMSPVPTQAPRP